jgi:hypothetical protein
MIAAATIMAERRVSDTPLPPPPPVEAATPVGDGVLRTQTLKLLVIGANPALHSHVYERPLDGTCAQVVVNGSHAFDPDKHGWNVGNTVGMRVGVRVGEGVGFNVVGFAVGCGVMTQLSMLWVVGMYPARHSQVYLS